MKSIEDEYPDLLGVLPKDYNLFEKDLLRELLRNKKNDSQEEE